MRIGICHGDVPFLHEQYRTNTSPAINNNESDYGPERGKGSKDMNATVFQTYRETRGDRNDPLTSNPCDGREESVQLKTGIP